MKIIVLFGSPRKDGNTMALVRAFSDPLTLHGDEVKILHLNDMDIGPCQGCMACLPEGICTIDDQMETVKNAVYGSDVIVFATPVYWFTVSAQLKLVMDRCLAFMDEDYNSRIKGKKVATIMTCGDENHAVCQPALDTFTMMFELLGLSSMGGVEATGCESTGGVKEEFKENVRKLAESLL